MIKILVIHGPNLQLLGIREPGVYGKVTLKQINQALQKFAKAHKFSLTIMQSDVEGEIVQAIGKGRNKFSGILINPAAYTHTSVAIRDALAAVSLPCVEVHLSNIHCREKFRSKSLISPVASGTVMGFGLKSYTLGLSALSDLLQA